MTWSDSFTVPLRILPQHIFFIEKVEFQKRIILLSLLVVCLSFVGYYLAGAVMFRLQRTQDRHTQGTCHMVIIPSLWIMFLKDVAIIVE